MTLVAWGPAVLDALAAADRLATEDGATAEVIDLRSLVPLDMETVLASVRKTGRCVVASQAVLSGSFVNEIVARIQAEAFDYLDGPVGPDRGEGRHLAAGREPRAGVPAECRRHLPGGQGAALTLALPTTDPNAPRRTCRMAHAILMPKPGQMTEECSVVEWHKQEGDPVHRGDVLFEIETDKSVMDVEAFDDGVLLKILVQAGEIRPGQHGVRLRRRGGRGNPGRCRLPRRRRPLRRQPPRRLRSSPRPATTQALHRPPFTRRHPRRTRQRSRKPATWRSARAQAGWQPRPASIPGA